MRESPVRVVLRRVQDIVVEATGQPLRGDAARRLESVLEAFNGNRRSPTVESFSHREVTILVADLRGFTSLSGAYPAAVVLEILNQCFVRMSDAIVRHHGTIDKFTGDSIMAIFFGRVEAPGDDVRQAVTCAVEMQVAMEALNREHRDRGLPALYMGMGINTGGVMAGLVGSELYSAYALIGEDVSLTSRIEAFSLRGQVLISQATYTQLGDFALTGEPMEVFVKGKADRMQVREVLAIPSLALEVPRQEIRRSPRIAVTLPFSCQTLERKIVMPERAQGTILDIGYHGVLAQTERALGLFSEVKLDLELPLVVHRASDIYARVVKSWEEDGRRLAGLEFTSLSAESNGKLQLFVQMLMQGQQA